MYKITVKNVKEVEKEKIDYDKCSHEHTYLGVCTVCGYDKKDDDGSINFKIEREEVAK